MKAVLTSALAIVLGLFALPAFAQEEGGVGIVAGDTNGITVKIPTADVGSLDLAAGIDLNIQSDDINPSDGRFRADWSLPFFTHTANSRLDIPFYVGAGAFLELDDVDMGVRAPLGVALDFEQIPLEVFAQTGIEARILDQGVEDRTVGLNGAVGMRISL